MIPNIENRLFIEKGFGIACLAVLLTGVPSVSAQSGTDFQPLEEFQRGQREVHLAIESTVFPNPVMAGGEFNLFIQVNLPQGWHIYSLQNREDTLPTRIRLGENLFTPQGEWQESLPRITHDGVLQEMVKAHEKTAEFSRALQAPGSLSPGRYFISGTLTYRLCDNKVCHLPKELAFLTPMEVISGEDRARAP
ncbi:MAG: protein-disulfide reductase DsbD domain-containing protein [Nitrospinota bacterium]|nr:protein-disulfide reductase DsbD domain-containing protein [Nitrospinota bacterium]